MSSAASEPQHLRLVGISNLDASHSQESERSTRQAIIRENRLAAGNPQLDAADPRWVLAMRAYSQLQGSTLTPQRRERVLRTAKKLGVRAFDANLIIAVVQDHARRMETPADAVSTLSLIGSIPSPSKRASDGLGRLIVAIITALMINVFLIWWLKSG